MHKPHTAILPAFSIISKYFSHFLASYLTSRFSFTLKGSPLKVETGHVFTQSVHSPQSFSIGFPVGLSGAC